MRRPLAIIALGAAAVMAPPATAQVHVEQYNGTTCVPVPATGDANPSFPAWSFFFGYEDQAHCPIELPNGFGTDDIDYAILTGGQLLGSGTISARLCVSNLTGYSWTCGFERTISSSFGVQVLYPPTLPSLPNGIFVQVRFADGGVMLVRNVIARFQQ